MPLQQIVMEVKGGLGNQMFQLATLLALQKSSATHILLHQEWFKTSGRNHNCLPLLPHGVDVTEGSQANAINRTLRKSGLLQKVFDSLLKRKWNVITETPDGSFMDLSFLMKEKSRILLDGYWQNEAYFLNQKEDLRKMIFSQGTNADLKFSDLGKRISESNCPVLLQVRRGDYASVPKNRSYHGLIPLSYYEKAIESIRARTSRPTLYVFSDDIPWCRATFPKSWGDLYFVETPPSSPVNDILKLQLMASCRHHIIANSSFSWWGAWLAERPGQIVIAPKQWYAPGSGRTDSPVPERWERA